MNKVAERPVKRRDAPPDSGRAIGAILVEQGRLSAQDLDEIQRFANSHGVRFGEAALQLKRITEHDIESALAQQYNYPVLARGGEGGVADDVIAAHQPQSDSVEPLRALRSQLILRWYNNAVRKVLAVTSAERGEGRSWLAANLATMFAQLGERTLLIDADMRHPRQHRLFNLDNSVGLSSLLTGRAGGEIARRIHPQLRLYVLAGRNHPAEPARVAGAPGVRGDPRSFCRAIQPRDHRFARGVRNRGRADSRRHGRKCPDGRAPQSYAAVELGRGHGDLDRQRRERRRQRHQRALRGLDRLLASRPRGSLGTQ